VKRGRGDAVQVKRFNWIKRPTPWESAQAWRNHRREMAQQFMNEGAMASTAFLNAQNSLSSGMANLTAQMTIQRVQAQAKAKVQSVDLSM
jgi:hypothetical protein